MQKTHQAHVKWRELRVVDSLGLNVTLQLSDCSFPAGAFLLFVMICDMWLSVAFGFPQKYYAFLYGFKLQSWSSREK